MAGAVRVGFFVLLLLAADTLKAARPNFVFILVDDLGYMDVGANNPDTFYETPNIDRLAKQGVRFTNGYAANPVCSPTRFSIMTGKYPSRADATNFFSGRRGGRFLPAPLHDRMPLSETTLAEALKESGYRTAFIGKWHLGPTEQYWPEAQGFDLNIGGYSRGMPAAGFFSPYKNPRLSDGIKGEYLTTRLTDESLKIIDQFKDDPFLLYLSFYTVHIPIQAPAEIVAKYKKKAAAMDIIGGKEFAEEEQALPTNQPRRVRILQNHPTYAAMVEMMDTSIGRVLARLKQRGLDKNTVVCFMSDNGGLSTSEGLPTSNLPLRGGKGWLYEGGIREPFVIKVPGYSGVRDEAVVSTDFYPTILELAGLPPKPRQHLDGVSLVKLIQQNKALQRDAIYWHYPHYSNQGGIPGGAIRVGDLKLIERFEDGRVHLYNVKEDIGERNDLATKMPDRVKQMRAKLHDWYKEVDAKFLQAKPNGPKPWRPPT